MTRKITADSTCAKCAAPNTALAPEKVCEDHEMTEAAEELAAMSLRDGGDDCDGNERLVCFVCTGNTCRSPMAAAWLNYIAHGKDGENAAKGAPKLRAVSAGLYPHDGDPISLGAAAALTASGIDSTADNPWREHRATRINEGIMKECSVIVGISGSHTLALITEFPQYAGKICAMPRDISDPFGGSDEQYRVCLEDIKEGIGELFGE